MDAARYADQPNGPTLTPAPLAPNLILFLGLFLLLASAMAGALGGGPYRRLSGAGPEAAIEVAAPKVLRTGEFFEVRLSATANRAVARPTIVLGAGLLRNATVNSFYPAADGETSGDDEFRFEYPPLKPGDRFAVKIDGQVNDNMTGTLAGPVTLRDGGRDLAAVDLVIKVLP